MSEKAFVTGGSGFIGGRLIERLVREGWSVRALARSNAAAARLEELGAEGVHGDTEGALLAGQPLLEADERTPLRPDSPVPYSATKAKAEIEVLAASEEG